MESRWRTHRPQTLEALTPRPMARIRLSYVLDGDQPNWPGSPGLRLHDRDRIANGDAANTTLIEIYSHYGTHVDAPVHFVPGGASLSDFAIDEFVYERPVVLDLPLGESELITGAMLRDHADRIRGHDLVLIRSGHERLRSDRHRYEHLGPGWSTEGARTLRAEFPEVRAVALDWLSLCAVQHVAEGVGAHVELLTADALGRVVLIYEDVCLSVLAGHTPSRVYALPLLIDGIDGGPCTIVAELADGDTY